MTAVALEADLGVLLERAAVPRNPLVNAGAIVVTDILLEAYGAAGEFAYRVGLPGKSGVSGGLLAIVPGRCALCAWSPRLDEAGNSVAAVAALDAFTTLTGWSVF